MNGSFRVAVVTIRALAADSIEFCSGAFERQPSQAHQQSRGLCAHRRAFCAGGLSRDIVIDRHRRSGVSLRPFPPRLAAEGRAGAAATA